jgi:hypothetical protein
MTDPAGKNVVRMSQYDATRKNLSLVTAVNTLNDCRDTAVSRFSACLSKVLETAPQRLSELAEDQPIGDARNNYLFAASQISQKPQALETAFRAQFLSSYNAKAKRGQEANAPSKPLDSLSLELSLVEDEDLEQGIAYSDLAGKLKDCSVVELRQLTPRLGLLVGQTDMDDDSNPIGPKVISEALKSACDELTVGWKGRLALLKLCEETFAIEVPAVYKDINAHLTAKQIVADTRPRYKMTKAAKLTPGGASARTDGLAGGADGPAIDPQQFFANLQQLFMLNNRGGPQLSMQAADPSAAAALAAAPLVQRALESLTHLQHGDVGLVTGDGRSFAPGTLTAGEGNVLREIRASNIGAHLGQVDAITIDIVAMLFDYMFEDEKIPDAIKALIGRLQIPVLKVAILDKTFFSSKSHPARKLVDMLAAASIGWQGGMGHGDRFYAKTERIVERVLTEFENDISIFRILVEDLEAFLSDEDVKAAESEARAAQIIGQREQEEIGRVIVHDEIKRRKEKTTVPAVRGFLGKYWQQVLYKAYVKAGEEGPAWNQALVTMDELLWSIEPKSSAEERKLLVTLLPTLLKRLQSGIATTSMSDTQKSGFFSALVKCHAAAVKAGLQPKTLDASTERIATPLLNPVVGLDDDLDDEENEEETQMLLDPREIADELAKTRLSDGVNDIEEIKLRHESSDSSEAVSVEVAQELAETLRRGTWVEFHEDDGATFRAKLSWISPRKHIYLFTNVSLSKAISISPQAMAMKLVRGTAIVMEDLPLLDRAVDHMLDALQSQQSQSADA